VRWFRKKEAPPWLQELQENLEVLRKANEELKANLEKLEKLVPKARTTVADLTRAKNEADRAADQARSAARSTRSGKSW